MATVYRSTITNFISYETKNGDKDFREEYVEKTGLLILFECSPERKHAGLHFFYFLPNELENFYQRYFNSSCGKLVEDDDKNVKLITEDASYVFGGEVAEKPLEYEVLRLNAVEVMKHLEVL